VNPDQKAEAWRRFLSVVNIDNPFSNEDDEMRMFAQSWLSHWQNETSVASKPSAPAVAVISPEYHEVARDGNYIKYENGVVLDTKTGLE
jgi:hypothetical protein